MAETSPRRFRKSGFLMILRRFPAQPNTIEIQCFIYYWNVQSRVQGVGVADLNSNSDSKREIQTKHNLKLTLRHQFWFLQSSAFFEILMDSNFKSFWFIFPILILKSSDQNRTYGGIFTFLFIASVFCHFFCAIDLLFSWSKHFYLDRRLIFFLDFTPYAPLEV